MQILGACDAVLAVCKCVSRRGDVKNSRSHLFVISLSIQNRFYSSLSPPLALALAQQPAFIYYHTRGQSLSEAHYKTQHEYEAHTKGT